MTSPDKNRVILSFSIFEIPAQTRYENAKWISEFCCGMSTSPFWSFSASRFFQRMIKLTLIEKQLSSIEIIRHSVLLQTAFHHSFCDWVGWSLRIKRFAESIVCRRDRQEHVRRDSTLKGALKFSAERPPLSLGISDRR
jgi:hypothetical protein